jgi:hypothetical protein
VDVYELNLYYNALDSQLKIDLCYREKPWTVYRDYFRASDIVARDWDSGHQTIEISYRPVPFLDRKLVAGLALTQIALQDSNTPYQLHSDHEDPDRQTHGALERTVFGAKYTMDDRTAFSLMCNLGNTGGSNYWFLNKDANDKDMEDGYFDIFDANPYKKVRSELGFSIGARAGIGEYLDINGDAELIGLENMERSGMFAAGLAASYLFGDWTFGIVIRDFNFLGKPEVANVASGGIFGIHPSVAYAVVPSILTASLRFDFVSGSGDELSGFQFIKLNPKLMWNVDGFKNAYLELGYTYRYDFNKIYKDTMENAINLKAYIYF